MLASLERREPGLFRARPEGGYLAGASWIYFCVDLGLFGFALWGTPSPEDMTALVTLLEIELDRPPHVAIVDVKELATALAPSFEALAGYFRNHDQALARVVTRSAIVKGEGLAAAVAAGFMGTVPPTFAASLADDLVTALASLEVEDAPAIAEMIERAKREAAGTPAVVRELHAWLDLQLAEGVTVDDAARGLANATRTLQRRLAEASTSFAEEVQRARVRAAQRLLVDTDAAITTIAIDVGCSSPQHLSTLFKKYVGETPSAWRTRVREGRARERG